MNTIEFQELVLHIRDSFSYSIVGLSLQEIQQLNQRLDSDAYAAASAVYEFFEAKRSA